MGCHYTASLTKLLSIFSATTLLFYLPFVEAQSLQDKGLAIAIKADSSDTGFISSRADMTMKLYDNKPTPVERQLTALTLEGDDKQGDRFLVRFNSPLDMKNTTLLIHSNLRGNDSQWLYLPILKRSRRITGNTKASPFVGSEFTYEDLAPVVINKYDYLFIREEPCRTLQCNVVERRNLDPHSAYKRQLVWIDQTHQRIWQIHYFDKHDSHIKTLTASDYRQHLGKYWRPKLVTMNNHSSQNTTELHLNHIEFGIPLQAKAFHKNQLGQRR